MKRKNRMGDVLDTAGQILFVILLIAVIALVIGMFTGHTLQIGATLRDKLSGDVEMDSEYVPPVQSSCKSYDINKEYEIAYGKSNIDKLETGCKNIGGIYYRENDRMGCYWNPSVHTFDCDSQASITLGHFCENLLKATWTCNNDIAFAGCTCQGGVPQTWEEECWWNEIDSFSGELRPYTRTEWKNTLVQGKFKWEWEFAFGSNVEIVRENAVVQYYPDSSAGGYTFIVSSTQDNGIAATNPKSIFVNAQIKLFQWVCEGDSLNWDPNMFDKPYSETQPGGIQN